MHAGPPDSSPDQRADARYLPSLLLLAFALAAPGGALAFHFPWDQGHDTFTPERPDEGDNPPGEDNRCYATDAGGRSPIFTKGPNGKAASATDPLGRSYRYDYDAEGFLVSVTDPARASPGTPMTPTATRSSSPMPMGKPLPFATTPETA